MTGYKPLLLIAAILAAPLLNADSKTERAQIAAQQQLIQKLASAQKAAALARSTSNSRHEETTSRLIENSETSSEILADLKQLVQDSNSATDRRAGAQKKRDEAALLSQELNAGEGCAQVLIIFLLGFIIHRQRRTH